LLDSHLAKAAKAAAEDNGASFLVINLVLLAFSILLIGFSRYVSLYLLACLPACLPACLIFNSA
jgi:hypothetical protein